MKYLFLIIGATLAVIFIVPLRNEAGAVIMGLDAAGIDFLLQWLRFKLSNSQNAKTLGLVVFSGLLVRAASLFLFLQIGSRWFHNHTARFYMFAVSILVLVPVLSLLAAYKFKPQRD